MASDPSDLDARSKVALFAAKPVSLGSPLAFFLLTYAVSWMFFIPAAAISRGALAGVPTGNLELLILPGVFAPAWVAIALTARAEGSAGVRTLLQRMFQWRVDARWFLFAVGYMVAIKLTVALIHRVALGAWPRFGNESWYVMAVAIVFSTPVQSGEEIGWRGYALPGLATHWGFARASILLGVIWATWHLPLFFLHGADKDGQSFFVYVLQVTALSVAMAWLYVRTRGSLLLTMLMHAAGNNTKDIVPAVVPGATNTFGLSASPVSWIGVVVLWLCAAYFLVRMRAVVSDRSQSV